MNTSLSRLSRIPLERHLALPRCSGVYIAIDASDTVHYIGAASNIRNRWISHPKAEALRSIGNISIAWIEAHRDCMKSIEIKLIEEFRPSLNWVGPITEYCRKNGEPDPAFTPSRAENARRRVSASQKQ